MDPVSWRLQTYHGSCAAAYVFGSNIIECSIFILSGRKNKKQTGESSSCLFCHWNFRMDDIFCWRNFSNYCGKKHWLSYQCKTDSFKQLSYNLSGSNSYIHNVFLHNGIASQKSFPAKVFSEWSDFQTARSFKSRDKTFICRELCFCYFISNILYVPYNKKSDGSEQYWIWR